MHKGRKDMRGAATRRLIAAGTLAIATSLGCTRPPAGGAELATGEGAGSTDAAAAQGAQTPPRTGEKQPEKLNFGQGTPGDALSQLRGRGEVRVGDAESPVLRVELARTAEERAQGLMFRRHLADDAGMVFDMESSGVWSFWMKNTLIPLDIIFVDAGWRVVCVVPNAAPETLESRGCNKPSRWVLELRAGNAARYGIAAGTPLRWRPLPDAAPGQGTP